LGFGVGVLGFGVWPPTPNPQSPIPNPQSPFINIYKINLNNLFNLFKNNKLIY
jgi:hypothetical protein